MGDREHCNSFFERWIGFEGALTEAGLQPDERLCILEKDGVCYGDTDWLLTRLDAMPVLPDDFACATPGSAACPKTDHAVEIENKRFQPVGSAQPFIPSDASCTYLIRKPQSPRPGRRRCGKRN